jgi:tetratricopeptide (TPR) repeat protein
MLIKLTQPKTNFLLLCRPGFDVQDRLAGLISEFLVDVFAYNFQSAQDEQMLFVILAKSIEFFPDFPSAFERPAFVHYDRGNKELALQYFERVLELDPGNRNATIMINGLRHRQ